jgi:hypothetical protein
MKKTILKEGISKPLQKLIKSGRKWWKVVGNP